MRTYFRERLWAWALVGLLLNSAAAVRADDDATEGFIRITDGKSAAQGSLFRTVNNPVHQGRGEVAAFGKQPEGVPAPLPEHTATQAISAESTGPVPAEGAVVGATCGAQSCGCDTCGCGTDQHCGSHGCKTGNCFGSCLGRKCDSCGDCEQCGGDGCGSGYCSRCGAGGLCRGVKGCCNGPCGICGLAGALCACKHSPDHGWGRPIKQPIYRTPVTYRHYWPMYWYGESGGGITANMPTFPMAYMPTDTTQLGFYYQRVPTWTPNPAMIPPTPWPAHWHKRECMNNTFGYFEVTDPVYGGY